MIAVSAVVDYDGRPGGRGEPTCQDYGPDDTFAPFSNRGRIVDFAAPGTCIATTSRAGLYTVANGTSFAAPHVAAKEGRGPGGG